MSTLPPTRGVVELVGAIAVAVALTGCGSQAVPPPDVDAGGLLIAADGVVRTTTADGELVPFEAPDERIQTVVAGGGRVVIVGLDGRAWTASVRARASEWMGLPASIAEAGDAPLIALSTAGDSLAAARGDPQGQRFDLAIVAVPSGEERRIPVPRGINGPPSWLSPSAVVLDVIDADGRSGLAAIDVETGAVRDAVGPGVEVASSADGRVVAFIDADGHVLVGDSSGWQSGRIAAFTRLDGLTSSSAERIAMSADGRRVAILHRDVDGTGAVDIWLQGPHGWARAGAVAPLGDGPVSIAWIR